MEENKLHVKYYKTLIVNPEEIKGISGKFTNVIICLI
jgi:hypothetical protein